MLALRGEHPEKAVKNIRVVLILTRRIMHIVSIYHSKRTVTVKHHITRTKYVWITLDSVLYENLSGTKVSLGPQVLAKKECRLCSLRIYVFDVCGFNQNKTINDIPKLIPIVPMLSATSAGMLAAHEKNVFTN